MRKLRPRGGKQLGQGHTAAEVWDRNVVLSDADAINHKLSYQGQKIYGINSGSLKTNEPNCFKMTDKVAKLPSEVLMTKKLGEKKHTVVRNISYSQKYLQLGQAGHWQVKYLYLAGARNGNGDRLTF